VRTKAKRGRPRSTASDQAILDAAAAIMATKGYRGMTVAAVATAAGVTEPTVYLRHPTKHDLAVAAIPRLPVLQHPPHTGDTRSDLVALLARLVETSEAIGISMTGVVLAEQHEHPELLARWRASVGVAALDVVNDIVQSGRQRGELRADVDAEITADLLLGAYLAHYTHQGHPNRAWVDDIVDTLWRGLAARSSSHSSPAAG
jgi:AcrR family transcriptional regulator